MNCNAIQEGISALIDNELRDDESKPVFAHLSECHACRGFLRTAMHLRSTLSSAAALAVPATRDERVQSIQVGDARPTRAHENTLASWWRHRLAIPVPAVAFAIALMLLTAALSFAMWSRQYQPERQDTPTVVYVISMPPIEVQGTSVSPIREVQ